MFKGVLVSEFEQMTMNYISDEDKLYLEDIVSRTNYTESSICDLLGISINQLRGTNPLSNKNQKSISLFIKAL